MKSEHRAGVTQAAPAPAADAATPPLPTPRIPPQYKQAAPAQEEQQSGMRRGDALTAGSIMFMADVLVGEKLKELITKRLQRHISRDDDRNGVKAFYRENGYAPVWISNGAPNLRARSVIAVMASAEADGLDPARYRIPDFQQTQGDPERLAAAELELTEAVLTYARHAQAGRFAAEHVTPDLEVTQKLPDAAAVLSKLARASDAAAALNGYNPPHPGYKALKAKLAELRKHPVSPVIPIVIPAGPTLKRGMIDPRVPLLRKRLNVPGNTTDIAYDDAVIAAVRKFQRASGLTPDGILGPRSLELLNGSVPRNKVEAVIANMERWRWLPRQLGNTYVMVNIPDFSLKVVDRGKTVWTTRIVVGKPETPTPLLSAQIENILLNPTWNVPESIIYNEYLPALQRDPRVLERLGLVLERARDGRLVIKQPPGEENALGRMKFNFSNRFHVYLHDTPTKHLFARPRRAFSHGCMRVENPAKFGEVLLSIANPRDGYTEARLQEAWGGPEQWIKLRRKIPVHLVYMSADVDDEGRLVIRNDIYGFDKKIAAILKGDERQLIGSYTAPAPKPTVIDAEKRRELERFVDRRDAFGALLENLFR